jgi:putative transcriptional regulator
MVRLVDNAAVPIENDQLIDQTLCLAVMIKIHLSRMLGERKERIADLQRETGLARNTLSGLYRETTARIDMATLDALCRHFSCSVGELLERVPGDEDANKKSRAEK